MKYPRSLRKKGDFLIPATDPIFGHLTNRERRYVNALQRRSEHLQARIDAALTVDLTYDKHEVAAIRWALGVIANARKEPGDGMV